MENFVAKILLTAIICKISSILSGVNVFAQDSIEIKNPLKIENIAELIERVMAFLFWLGVVLLPLFLFIGAFYLVTSGGNKERISKGKRIIVYATVGYLLLIGAKAIIGLVFSAIGLTK